MDEPLTGLNAASKAWTLNWPRGSAMPLAVPTSKMPGGASMHAHGEGSQKWQSATAGVANPTQQTHANTAQETKRKHLMTASSAGNVVGGAGITSATAAGAGVQDRPSFSSASPVST